MRSFSIAVFAAGLTCLTTAQADTPKPTKPRVMGQSTVSDGQSVDWPNCIEGETPGVEYGRPESSHYIVGQVEVQSRFGSWTFHIQAFGAERHNPLSGDALKQVQLPITIYCKPNASN
ncbi:MAG TPA: hypothetical protein VGN70_03530 [Gammaproteobacteria bacterium]|jgi:hypothetical protein